MAAGGDSADFREKRSFDRFVNIAAAFFVIDPLVNSDGRLFRGTAKRA